MHLSRRIRKKMHSNNELQEVSRGHSTGGKKPGRAEQSQVLSKRRKETGMKNAEYCQETGCPQRDSAEHEEYAGAQSTGTREVGERDGARLLEAILSRGNLNNAYKRVRANGGAPGIDGMLSLIHI